jgi:hypothetical protein
MQADSHLGPITLSRKVGKLNKAMVLKCLKFSPHLTFK